MTARRFSTRALLDLHIDVCNTKNNFEESGIKSQESKQETENRKQETKKKKEREVYFRIALWLYTCTWRCTEMLKACVYASV